MQIIEPDQKTIEACDMCGVFDQITIMNMDGIILYLCRRCTGEYSVR